MEPVNCPKCQHPMAWLHLPEADVQRCTHCQGLWFQMRAHELLQAHADHIDVGDPAQGQQYNQIDRIQCPVCTGQRDLVRMVDPRQPHLWFESCKNCYGRFYDAGEYQDFVHHDLADVIKDWKTPERL